MLIEDMINAVRRGMDAGQRHYAKAEARRNSKIEAQNAKRREEETVFSNANERKVTEYHPCPVECLLNPYTPETCMVVSGGTVKMRNKILEAAIATYDNNGIPAVILHHSNKTLEQGIEQRYSRFEIINEHNAIYDPLVGLDIMQIANLAMSCNNDYFKLNPDCTFYFRGIAEYMQFCGVNSSIYAFADLPYLELTTRINNAVNAGNLDSLSASKMLQLLSHGAAEQGTIQLFFENLLYNNAIIPRKLKNSPATNITKILGDGKSLMIDLPAANDASFLKLTLADIRQAMSKCGPFAIIIDDMQLADNKDFTDFVASLHEAQTLVLLNQDVYSSIGSDDKVFNTLVGRSGKNIVMKHSSAVSSSKWADVFGEYERQEISHSYGYSSSDSSPGTSHNTSTNKSKVKRVSPEQIVQMNEQEVYLSDRSTANIACMQVFV